MPDSKLIDVFLMPGDYFVGDERYRVRTLLGSCVSVTLWHPSRRIGAMSHFLLPGSGHRKAHDKPGMYGDDAMTLLLDGLARHGVAPTQCQAKIFGGGAMFPRSPNVRANVPDIGQQNKHDPAFEEETYRRLGGLTVDRRGDLRAALTSRSTADAKSTEFLYS